MKLIFGLGNPGKEYEKTRHNVGFLALDYLQEKYDFPKFTLEKKLRAELSGRVVSGEPHILVKPQTFMNLSGEAVSLVLNYYKAEPEDCIIIFDDIDIPLGSYRYKAEGSGGTHNGMKSVVQHLGNDIPRLRIGIQPDHPISNLSSFVLDNFSSFDMRDIELVFKDALDIETFFKEE